MSTDPTAIFENDDITTKYDFDKITLSQKISFMREVFERQINFAKDVGATCVEEVINGIKDKLMAEIVFNLRGRLNFWQISVLIASFVERKQ